MGRYRVTSYKGEQLAGRDAPSPETENLVWAVRRLPQVVFLSSPICRKKDAGRNSTDAATKEAFATSKSLTSVGRRSTFPAVVRSGEVALVGQNLSINFIHRTMIGWRQQSTRSSSMKILQAKSQLSPG